MPSYTACQERGEVGEIYSETAFGRFFAGTGIASYRSNFTWRVGIALAN